MATAKTHCLPHHLVSYAIRPALVEGKLITEKHAGDAVYVATLAEELRNIETQIAAMEAAAQISSSAAAVQLGARRVPEDWPDASVVSHK